MPSTKQRLRALDRLEIPDVWGRALSLDPSIEPEGSTELPMSKRLVAITVAFVLFAVAGVFVWQGFRSSPPNPPAAPSDAISRTVLWPERTQAALAAAQASADAGDPGTAWRTDAAKVAARFAEDVLGWGPAGPAGGTYDVRIANVSATGQAEAVLQRFALPCPSPAPGTVSSCPPPYEGETVALRQGATTGPTGIWSVTEVRASDNLRLDLQPGEEIPSGTSITGSVTYASTASAVPNFSAAVGIHVGANGGCAIVQGREVQQGEGSLFTVSVPSDAQAGTDCGSTPGGYAWIATAPLSLRHGDAVADPLASSGDSSSPTFYGLTLVPVQVSIPENQPPASTPTGAPGGTDLGLGYPLCNVSTITTDLVGNGTPDTAYLGTAPPKGGNCLTVTHGPTPQFTLNTFLAIDTNGDGRADDVQGPLRCQLRCSFLAAPDLVGDAQHELAVAFVRGFGVGFYLFTLEGPRPAGQRPILTPISARPSAGQTEFWIGGSTQVMSGVYCTPGRIVVWSASETHEGNGPYQVDLTTNRFVLGESLERISRRYRKVSQSRPDLLPQQGGVAFGGPKNLCGAPLLGQVQVEHA